MHSRTKLNLSLSENKNMFESEIEMWKCALEMWKIGLKICLKLQKCFFYTTILQNKVSVNTL